MSRTKIVIESTEIIKKRYFIDSDSDLCDHYTLSQVRGGSLIPFESISLGEHVVSVYSPDKWSMISDLNTSSNDDQQSMRTLVYYTCDDSQLKSHKSGLILLE